MFKRMRWSCRHTALALLVFALLSTTLSACSTFIASPTPIPPTFTPTVPPPTATELPPTQTATLPPPTETPTITLTPTPTDTPVPTATPTEVVPTSTPSGDDAIYIYYILKPSEKGCGGQVIPVNIGMPRTDNPTHDVKTALSRLFTFHSLEWGNLYNPLALSAISVSEVTYQGDELLVKLTGDLVRTGDPCDNSRMRAQIWTTIRQFPEFKSGHINAFLNSSLLGDLLEGK